MEVICLQTEAFHRLIDEVVERIAEKQKKDTDIWLDTEAAMALIGIKSKSTLQDLRDKGLIRFTQPMKRIILYDKKSILSYLDSKAKDTF